MSMKEVCFKELEWYEADSCNKCRVGQQLETGKNCNCSLEAGFFLIETSDFALKAFIWWDDYPGWSLLLKVNWLSMFITSTVSFHSSPGFRLDKWGLLPQQTNTWSWSSHLSRLKNLYFSPEECTELIAIASIVFESKRPEYRVLDSKFSVQF